MRRKPQSTARYLVSRRTSYTIRKKLEYARPYFVAMLSRADRGLSVCPVSHDEPYYDSVWKSDALPHLYSRDQKPRAFSSGLDSPSYFSSSPATAQITSTVP